MTKLLTIAVAAFGLAYACLWWSFQRFYAPFGVSPEDVGLAPSGSSASLPGAALQLGVWLLVALAILAVLPTLSVAAGEIAVRAKSRARWAWTAGLLLLAGSGGLYWWLVGGLQGLAVLAVAAALFAALQYGLPWTIDALTTTRSVSPRESPKGLAAQLERLGTHGGLAPRLRLAFGIFLAAAVVGLAFLDLPSDAEEAAACAAGGVQAVPELNIPVPGLHLPILSVHAQPATLTWLIANPPADIHTSTIVYLGQGGGLLVVYDTTSERTSRIPAGTAVVRVDPNAPDCPGVH